MVSPKRSESGIPVGILIIVIGTVGLIGLVGLGAWSSHGLDQTRDHPADRGMAGQR